MNFTQEIKRELLRTLPEKRCCKLALICAALDTCGDWSLGRVGIPDGFSFTSEREEVAEYFLSVAEQLFGIRMTLTEAVKDPKHGRDKLTFSYSGIGAGEFADEITDRSPANGLDPCCAVAYLKGAFLGSGSCSLPRGERKGYHLEFVFHTMRDAQDFAELADGLQLLCNVIPRGESAVVYAKNRETISDFLSVAGAAGALATLERVTSEREETNRENRVSNCYAGNADKTAIASAAQAVHIGKLRAAGIFGALPEALRETAEARLTHPELSLAELAATLEISKSCLNHRLRKLMAIPIPENHI